MCWCRINLYCSLLSIRLSSPCVNIGVIYFSSICMVGADLKPSPDASYLQVPFGLVSALWSPLMDLCLSCEKAVCWHFSSGLRASVSTEYCLSGAFEIMVWFPNAFRTGTTVLMGQEDFKDDVKSSTHESCHCKWGMQKDFIDLMFIPLGFILGFLSALYL